MYYSLTNDDIERYFNDLSRRGIAAGSQGRYRTNIGQFKEWLQENGKNQFDSEDVIAYKTYLMERGEKASTINVKLSSLNGLFKFLGYHDCRTSFTQHSELKVSEDGDLTEYEYERLLEEAVKSNKKRIGLIIQTLAETGIRVSELSSITRESLDNLDVVITDGSKERTIRLNPALRRKLKLYAEQNHIEEGPVFVTRTGKPLTRTQVWMDMQRLSQVAHIDPEKVSPHSLRRFFAINYYEQNQDVMALANELGLSGLGSVISYLN